MVDDDDDDDDDDDEVDNDDEEAHGNFSHDSKWQDALATHQLNSIRNMNTKTLTLKSKKQLNDVYNLQVISKDKLYICIAITISFIVIYKYIKK
jgi:hypothetical protein